MSNENNTYAVMFMLIHSLTLSVISAISRILSHDFGYFQILFYMDVISFLALIPFMYFCKQEMYHSRYTVILQFFRSCLSMIGSFCLIFAYSKAHFAQIAGITLVYPLITTLLAIIFLSERVGVHRFLSLLTGFFGGYIIVSADISNMGGLHSFNDVNIPVISAIFAMFLWGIVDLLTKIETASVWTQTFFILFYSTIMTFVFMMIFDSTVGPQNIKHILIFVLLAFFNLICYTTLFEAFQKGDICVITPAYFSSFIAAAFISYFVFDEPISYHTFLGALIIVLSVSYIAYREYKMSKIRKDIHVTTSVGPVSL